MKNSINYKKYFVFATLSSVVLFGSLLPNFVFAQKTVCDLKQPKAELEKCLLRVNAEIQKLSGDINVENKQQQTLSGEINKLTGEIKKTTQEIGIKNSLIKNIKNEITGREKTLNGLNNKLQREKQSLASILRKRYKLNDSTLLEVLMSRQTISDFYHDAPTFAYVQDSLSDSFTTIDILKKNIYNEKTDLEKKKQDEDVAKYGLQVEQGKIQVQKKDRDQALGISKTKEASLAQLKKVREDEARKIRAELIRFQGSGVTSRSISFGEAYDYAKYASGKTGVSPGFIMAIMQQETGFGNNVGGCYLTEKPENSIGGVFKNNGIYIKSGNPSKKNMIPNHFDAFLRITSSLGLDWRKTPISCALIRSDGSLFGHGGAMGYTQFIPGTWEMVQAKVRANLGVTIADPWNPKHAVMATAVFMQSKGATGDTQKNYNAYYNAACNYYGACSNYASSVMGKTANIQTSITALERS
jgi:peptidoglycan hydrolase CwlO-like protein